MTEQKMFCLDKNHSTTRMLSDVKPMDRKTDSGIGFLCFLPTCLGRKGKGGLRTRGYFKKRIQGKPLISVITVVLNRESCLEKSLRSVLDQDYENVEYILIDGASTDGTLDIIARYEDFVDYWVSEPDNGIYHAMNKGLELTAGDWIFLLGADDYFANKDTLKTMARFLDVESDIAIHYGNLRMAGENRNGQQNWSLKNLRKGVMIPPPFIKRDIAASYDGFNTSYRIAGDFDLVLRMTRTEKIKHHYMDVSIMRKGGISTDERYTYLMWAETRRALKKIMGKVPVFAHYALFKAYCKDRLFRLLGEKTTIRILAYYRKLRKAICRQ